MAAKYRKIDPRIWRDEKFFQLKPEDKLVAIYCLTAQANRCGIFVFSFALAAEELGMVPRTFAERFGRVVSAMKWRWDPTSRVLYLPRWWKYNHPESINVMKGNLTDLDDLPESQLVAEFTSNTAYISRSLTETLRERSPQPLAIQEQEQEQEQDKAFCSEPAPLDSEPDVPPVMLFPVAAKDHPGWPLYQSKIDEYRQSFPGVNLEAQLRKARQWCIDNPAKRKTPGGMLRFLNTWLSKAQDESDRVGPNRSHREDPAAKLARQAREASEGHAHE